MILEEFIRELQLNMLMLSSSYFCAIPHVPNIVTRNLPVLHFSYALQNPRRVFIVHLN